MLPPGVVIGRYGSLGSVHWIDKPFWPHNTALWVKDFKGNDARYLAYLLNTITHDGSAAAAVPGVNRNHLHAQVVRLPERRVQRRIAALLSTFDELIEINERRIELLEDLARSLYREWFVNFRFPGREEAEMVDSELGPIPEGWEAHPLGHLLELRYGKALPDKSRLKGETPVVSSAGVIDSHNSALCDGPGVVVGRKGNVGSVWWIEEPFFPIDTTYFVETDLPLGYVYWALRYVQFIDSHAAVPGLSRDQAYGVPFLLPGFDHTSEFDRIWRELCGLITQCRRQIANLARTRDLLLPRLVTGKLDISDIDLGVLTPVEPE